MGTGQVGFGWWCIPLLVHVLLSMLLQQKQQNGHVLVCTMVLATLSAHLRVLKAKPAIWRSASHLLRLAQLQYNLFKSITQGCLVVVQEKTVEMREQVVDKGGLALVGMLDYMQKCYSGRRSVACSKAVSLFGSCDALHS